MSRLVVAGRLLLDRDRQQEISTLDALALLAFDEALRTAEPSARAAHLSADCEIDADVERAARRARRFTGVDVRLMGTLEEAEEVVDAPEHVGRRREQLEVFRAQRLRLVGP